jgi:oligopeptide/dipeptide ABC transporter ATP-binding protein
MTVVAPLPTPADAPDATPIVEVSDLHVTLKSGTGPVKLVDGVSFAVLPGHAVALVGESGAGKSITCRAVLDLLNRRKFDVRGSVRFNGVEVSTMAAKARRRVIAESASLVFQDPTRSLNPTMRVGWQIAEAMYKSREHELNKAEAKVKAISLMHDVGIADPDERFFNFPYQLSGGMRQRIVIAIALSCQPKVIFCDEPTTSLDVTTQAQIMDLLDDLRHRLQIAVVLISHDLSLAASRVDETMVMYAGHLVEKFPASDVVGQARMPYSRALLRAVPGLDNAGEMPDPIPGTPPDPRHLPTGCSFHPRCSRIGDRCVAESPPLIELSPGHACACWHPEDEMEAPARASQSHSS